MAFKRKRAKPPDKLLWSIDDGLSFSSLSTWVNCREQFALSWIDGLTPKRLSIPLEFGSVFHQALENQFVATPREVIGRVTEHYRKHRLKTIVKSSDKDSLELILGLARIVFPHYCEYWRTDDALIKWVGREEKFDIQYPLPSKDITVRLRGMRDGLYEIGDRVFGLFETKTKSKILEREIMDTLHYDMQTMMYCITTYYDYGRYPNQIKYNVVRRPDLYYRKGEKLSDYLKRVDEDIQSRPDHYFKRYTATIQLDDIERFISQTLNPILTLFIDWWESIKKNPTREGRMESPYHFLNSSALVGSYGKVGMWDAIFGNMSPYYIRDKVFPELEQSIPDMQPTT